MKFSKLIILGCLAIFSVQWVLKAQVNVKTPTCSVTLTASDVCLNLDDDDVSGTDDKDEGGPFAAKHKQANGVTSDDDLVSGSVSFSVDAEFNGSLTVTADPGADKVKYWEDNKKTKAHSMSWDIENGKVKNNKPPLTFYIEGVKPSGAEKDVTLKAKLNGTCKGESCEDEDEKKITVKGPMDADWKDKKQAHRETANIGHVNPALPVSLDYEVKWKEADKFGVKFYKDLEWVMTTSSPSKTQMSAPGGVKFPAGTTITIPGPNPGDPPTVVNLGGVQYAIDIGSTTAAADKMQIGRTFFDYSYYGPGQPNVGCLPKGFKMRPFPTPDSWLSPIIEIKGKSLVYTDAGHGVFLIIGSNRLPFVKMAPSLSIMKP